MSDDQKPGLASTEQGFWTFQRTAGALLVASILPLALGLQLFRRRNGIQGIALQSTAVLVWERGSFLAAVVLTALGFVLLEAALHETNGRVMARLGVRAYFLGAVLLAVAEVIRLGQASYRLIVVYVVLALLSQAAIGAALLKSNLLPAWVGWMTIAWNLILLIVLPVVTPGDLYYPIAHHPMPLLIGIALLWRASG